MVPDVDDARNVIFERVFGQREKRFADAYKEYQKRKENIVIGPVLRELPHSRRRFIRPNSYDDSRVREDKKRLANGSYRFHSTERPWSPCASIKNRSQIILF